MRTKKDFEHQNFYNKVKYDRIGLMIPKGMGDEWKAKAKERNMSLNAFVQEAVKYYVEFCSVGENLNEIEKV